jgi:hypothetical protein
MLHDLRIHRARAAEAASFALGSILVLALAVGVNTAVFSLVNALLLRPLPGTRGRRARVRVSQ